MFFLYAYFAYQGFWLVIILISGLAYRVDDWLKSRNKGVPIEINWNISGGGYGYRGDDGRDWNPTLPIPFSGYSKEESWQLAS